ncbi:MAG: alkane 1-monooxygenase [Rhodobacterales bacterium]|nr:MAG: alkane 1-monooxygenase [Rhodobacterales bacterium]
MPAAPSFAIVSLAAAGLVALAAMLGGGWIWAALGYMTLIAWGFDKLLPQRVSPVEDARGADALSATLALVHFPLLGLVAGRLASGGSGFADWLGVFVAAGLFFGQVSNANAHELIHRGNRVLFNLGKWVYISLLFGHHTSAHLKVHHRFAASDEDPNTARPGESFYAFAPRAWRGSFRRGYEMERADIIRRGTGGATPYVTYVFGGLGFLALALAAFGLAGAAVLLALAAHAQTQLLLADYVQHYGLTRARRADGKLEPMGLAHSWNAGESFTRRLMLNAPLHSDHHAHPARRYPALALPARSEAPRLPASLPVMTSLALYPPGWRRVMGRALARWQQESGG